MAPKLSIIIPTRERSDTLMHTLRTLVDQDYRDCEFIVSDNHSQDNTKQVVEAFSDPRICYINTGKRVSMSKNWEFALEHARGSFVTYIGDDDGFIPGALSGAMAILERSQLNALVWEKIEYCWPDYIDEKMRNWFSLKNKEYTLRVTKGNNKLRQVIRFKDGYARLPCLYNGIVRRSLLDEIKEQSVNNVFFNSISPDVFSGIALSMVVDKYLYTDYPFSVNGASRHSNGTSFMRQQTGNHDSPKAKFIAENKTEYDPRIRIGPSPVIIVMGEYLLAKKYLPKLLFPDPSWRHYVNSLVRSSKNAFLPREILHSAEHTEKQLGLRRRVPKQAECVDITPQPRIGFAGERFNFIAPISVVNNIYDACLLVSGMLPESSNTQKMPPFHMFFKRLKDCVRTELIRLYRSI